METDLYRMISRCSHISLDTGANAKLFFHIGAQFDELTSLLSSLFGLKYGLFIRLPLKAVVCSVLPSVENGAQFCP
jgi:hypothetical protein